MLELSDRRFKAAFIKMCQQAIMTTLETNEKKKEKKISAEKYEI